MLRSLVLLALLSIAIACFALFKIRFLDTVLGYWPFLSSLAMIDSNREATNCEVATNCTVAMIVMTLSGVTERVESSRVSESSELRQQSINHSLLVENSTRQASERFNSQPNVKIQMQNP